MRSTSIRLSWVAAVVLGIWHPGSAHAVAIGGGGGGGGQPPLPAGDYYIAIDGGGYYTVSSGPIVAADDPFAGGYIYINPTTDMIDDADITVAPPVSGPNLTFTDIVSQSAASGNEYDVTLLDTTSTYDLNLVLDDASAIFAGSFGAAIDPATDLVQLPSTVVGDEFGGSLAVPAPPSLAVFASAIGLLGLFWRRGGSISAA